MFLIKSKNYKTIYNVNFRKFQETLTPECLMLTLKEVEIISKSAYEKLLDLT